MNDNWYKLFELLLDKLHWFILLIAIYIFREAISDLIKRLTNFSYKNKDTSVSMVTSEAYEIKETSDNMADGKSNTVVENTTEIEPCVEKVTKDEPWIGKMIDSFIAGNIEEAKGVYKKGIKTEDDDKQDISEAIYLCCLYKYNEPDEKIISKIQELVDSTKEAAVKYKLMVWLSLCFANANDYKREEEYWKQAFTQFNDDEIRVKCLIKWSEALINTDDIEAGRLLIAEHIKNFSLKEKSKLFRQMAEIEEEAGNKNQAIYCLDKAVEFDSSSLSTIFKAAYSDDLNIDRRLSVANYKKILSINPKHEYALNNLGVAAANENFEYKAKQLYKDAGDLGNSLALINRADSLFDVGFIDEAEEIAQSVLKMEDPHENVYSLLSRISTKRDTEEKDWKKYVKKCVEYQRFIRKYTEAYYQSEDSSIISKSWKLPNNDEVNSDMFESKLKLTWEDDRFTYKILAEINGQSINGTYSKKEKDDDKIYSDLNESYRIIGYMQKGDLFTIPTKKKDYQPIIFKSEIDI